MSDEWNKSAIDGELKQYDGERPESLHLATVAWMSSRLGNQEEAAHNQRSIAGLVFVAIVILAVAGAVI